MTIEFKIAAEAELTPEDEQVLEVPINGKTFYARRPTTAQAVLLNTALSDADGIQRLGAVFRIVESLMGEEARGEIEELIWGRQIDFGDLVGGSERNPDGGLLDQIFAEFSGLPTEPSTASSRSPRNGGRRSTGRTPGKGSTRSASPSTAS